MKKRGQGHIEVILSFLLFIGAITVIFIFLNPLSKPESKVPEVSFIQKEIIDEATSTIGKLSIILNQSDGCYNFNEADYEGNFIEIQNADFPRKFTIYFSDLFLVSNASNKNLLCDPASYTIGLFSTEEIIFKSKVQDLKTNYETNYQSLKNNLGIANDFSFNFREIDGNVFPELSVDKEIPSGVNVVSIEFPVRVINENAIITEYIIQIRGW